MELYAYISILFCVYVTLQKFLHIEVNKNLGRNQEMLICEGSWKKCGYYANSDRVTFKVIVGER